MSSFSKRYEVQFPFISTDYVQLDMNNIYSCHCPFMEAELFERAVKAGYIIPSIILGKSNDKYTVKLFKLSIKGKSKLHQFIIFRDGAKTLLPLKVDRKNKEATRANYYHGLPHGRYFMITSVLQSTLESHLRATTHTSVFITDGSKKSMVKLEKEILVAQL